MTILKKYIEELSLSNRVLLDKDGKESTIESYKNKVYNTPNSIPEEFLIYHVGPINQNMLKPSMITDFAHMGHVFFSTKKEDLEYYLNESRDADKYHIYFADMREIKHAQVQISYKSQVLFQDKIRARALQYKKKLVSHDIVLETIEDWMRKYTIPYNPVRAEKIKKRGDYLLLAAPIKVF